jgi:hypothetical protein
MNGFTLASLSLHSSFFIHNCDLLYPTLVPLLVKVRRMTYLIPTREWKNESDRRAMAVEAWQDDYSKPLSDEP